MSIRAWPLALLVCGATARADESVLRQIELAETRLFDEAAPSVVFIGNGGGFGSGFVIAPGLILTSGHVVPHDRADVVLFDGRRLHGKVVERADKIDLALLEADGPLPRPLPLELTAPRVGAFAAAIGHGRGGIWSLNVGIVSNLYPEEGARGDRPIFQTQIPLYPGSSGGPVLDRNGRVLGVVTAGLGDSPGINFAIRIDVAPRALRRLAGTAPLLTVRTAPGARVFLDGNFAGLGPQLSLLLASGEHVVTATLEGQGLQRRRFRFPAEREIDLAPRSHSKPGEAP
jgi:S1-C subfamily serine protease